jgi:hypothetical protein
MFAMTQTRPDIVSKPQEAHNKALQHVFRYLRGSTKLGIQYSASSDPELKIRGYTDADHSGTIVAEGRRSTSGYIFSINGHPMSWSSNRQTIVATSSSEAEYIGQFNAGTEAIWLKKFLDELDLQNLSTAPVTILGDNQAAIPLSKDPISHSNIWKSNTIGNERKWREMRSNSSTSHHKRMWQTSFGMSSDRHSASPPFRHRHPTITSKQKHTGRWQRSSLLSRL